MRENRGAGFGGRGEDPGFYSETNEEASRVLTCADLYSRSIVQSAVLKIDHGQARAVAGRPVKSRLR